MEALFQELQRIKESNFKSQYKDILVASYSKDLNEVAFDP